ncbi:MAG: hypothetical protein ACOZIN_15705 [Myxococcota bacterium]
MARSPIWSALAAACVAACSTAPPGANTAPAVTAVTPLTHEPYFPIATGTHAGIECNTCHGAFDSFIQFSCINCHAHQKPTVDPIHLGVVSEYTYGEQTCYACHPRGEALGFDHTRFFPIGPTAIHANVACTSCHLDPTNRKNFDCVSCHTDAATTPRHAAVPDYSWTSPRCYACHPDSSVPLNGVDHTAFFPIGAGTKHQGIGCATCHVDPNNRKVFDCISCHTHEKTATDLTHNGIPNYAYASQSCYGCHPQANVVGLVNHEPFFPIAAGSKHANISCATCHPVPGNRQAIDCISCHTHEKPTTDANHAGVTGYAYVSSSCFACHPRANVEGLVDHSRYFPIAAGNTHANISCATCHTVPGDRKQVTCAGTCHPSNTMSAKHTPVGGYQYTSPLCIRCHADSQVHLVNSHLPFNIRSGTKHYRRSCFSCHPALRTDKPFAANFNRTLISCSACHSKTSMDNKHQNRPGYQYNPLTCVMSGCHQDGRKP